MKKRLYAVIATMLTVVPHLLAYGEEAAVQNFFAQSKVFLVQTVGGGVFLLGLIYTGILMSMHKKDAMQKGGMTLLGGIVIFMAATITGLIQSWTGN
ncbi:MAG: TrbC/VirB2 family protein [Endomicrobiales bacterium]|jgi:type IV secretory pathway VirB2 component (pilin)